MRAGFEAAEGGVQVEVGGVEEGEVHGGRVFTRAGGCLGGADWPNTRPDQPGYALQPGDDLLRHRERRIGRGHPGVDRGLDQHLPHLLLRQPLLLQRRAGVQPKLLPPAQRRRDRQHDDAPGAVVQARPAPHLAPGEPRDELLELPREPALLRQRTVHPGIAQHGAAVGDPGVEQRIPPRLDGGAARRAGGNRPGSRPARPGAPAARCARSAGSPGARRGWRRRSARHQWQAAPLRPTTRQPPAWACGCRAAHPSPPCPRWPCSTRHTPADPATRTLPGRCRDRRGSRPGSPAGTSGT